MKNTEHDCQDTQPYECTVIALQPLYIPPLIVDLGSEGNTNVTCKLRMEIQLYRLWKCGDIQVSINHSEWVDYVTLPPSSENANGE